MKSAKLLTTLILASFMAACSSQHAKKVNQVDTKADDNATFAKTLQSEAWVSDCERLDTGSRVETVNFQKDPQIAQVTQSFYNSADCTGASTDIVSTTQAYEVQGTNLGLDKNARVQFYDVKKDSANPAKVSKDQVSKSYMIHYDGVKISMVDANDKTFFGNALNYTRKSILDYSNEPSSDAAKRAVESKPVEKSVSASNVEPSTGFEPLTFVGP
jgi:hypothetical protein